jgi:hypothetical protein
MKPTALIANYAFDSTCGLLFIEGEGAALHMRFPYMTIVSAPCALSSTETL